MDFVPIELAGQTYRLRYTADDLQDICRRLTIFQPAGAGKVTPPLLGTLLVNLDPDAFQFCLWAGLRHENKKLDPSDATKLIRDAIRSGQQYADLRRPIFRALVACGLAEFTPIIKILEDAAETEAPSESTEETDPGNAPTTPSTLRSVSGRADSSM